MEAAERLIGPAIPWWQQLGLVRRDFLGYLRLSAAQYGDIFVIQPSPVTRIVVLNSAALAHEVTVTRANEFVKSSQTRFMVGKFLGNGLVLSEGDVHTAQRKLLQPNFGAKGLAAFAKAAASHTNWLLERSRDSILDVEPAMTRLSMGVILECLVGAPTENVDASAAFRTLAEAIGGRFKAMPLPSWIPTPRNLRERRAIRNVEQLVKTLLEQRQERAGLLSTLGNAMDRGELTFGEVRDQIITLLFAGHETVAKTLSWTLLLLARRPDVQQRVRAEISHLAPDRELEPSDLPKLRQLTAVIKETMRLYPPVWVFDRSPVVATTVGGHAIGPKDVIYISPYLLHDDARYFARPRTFDPSRFAGGPRFPDGAYLPFGAGPRACIGQSQAFAETAIVVGTILKNHLVLDRGSGEVKPRPDATLAPSSPILLEFSCLP